MWVKGLPIPVLCAVHLSPLFTCTYCVTFLFYFTHDRSQTLKESEIRITTVNFHVLLLCHALAHLSSSFFATHVSILLLSNREHTDLPSLSETQETPNETPSVLRECNAPKLQPTDNHSVLSPDKFAEKQSNRSQDSHMEVTEQCSPRVHDILNERRTPIKTTPRSTEALVLNEDITCELSFGRRIFHFRFSV